jgi:AcrR family transcriptional regulator
MSPEHNAGPAGERRRAPRVDAARNRAALLEAARELFEERGPEVPLDEVARWAGLANATLYRHFETRAELIIAVYDGEVAQLNDLARDLLDASDPDEALIRWLEVFVRHVIDKRSLALALPEDPRHQRGALFTEWHGTMTAAAGALLGRAQTAGHARPEIETGDLLAIAAAIALTGRPEDRIGSLLSLVRHGWAT